MGRLQERRKKRQEQREEERGRQDRVGTEALA